MHIADLYTPLYLNILHVCFVVFIAKDSLVLDLGLPYLYLDFGLSTMGLSADEGPHFCLLTLDRFAPPFHHHQWFVRRFAFICCLDNLTIYLLYDSMALNNSIMNTK
jgi:hypothetical protein